MVAAAVVAVLSACDARSVTPVAQPNPASSVSSPQVRDVAQVASARVVALVGADGSSSRALVSVGSELLESVDTPVGSAVRAVAGDGRVRLQVELGDGTRAGGLARVPAGLWQFTVDGDVAVLRDPLTLWEIRRIRVGAGWGACSTGEVVVQSDGTNRLVTRDPRNLVELGSVRITGHWVAAQRLAGLACVQVEGRPQVWALVAGSDWVVRVDPGRGVVTAVASLARIRAEKVGLGGAIGAIAATSEPDVFWVSGAFPYRFKVRLVIGS
ncbi:glutamine cyclotransferase [Saccharothrix variisporea]|uniref:Glutamine cyclotransferase n=1 Tax=Saccharothrix variisporea TaxID=543527 RepID=A0A495X773_9PSEU|nr:glutamine cyclotransferase [Saccharothrix variisporea]